MKSSSIFNFEPLSRWRALPGDVHRWHLLLLAGAVAIVWLSFTALNTIYLDPQWRSPQARILGIGSSHAKSGLLPSQFDDRLGVLWYPAMSLELGSAALEHNIDKWPNLEVAVIAVDEWSLLTDSLSTAQDKTAYVIGKLGLSVWELPNLRGSRRFVLTRLRDFMLGEGFSALWEGKRLSPANFARVDAIRNGSEGPPPPRPEPNVTKKRSGQFRVQQLYDAQIPRAEINVEGLLQMVRLLKERGVRVVLLTYPVDAVYGDMRFPEWDEEIYSAVAAVRALPGMAATPFIDLTDDPRFDPEWDYDNGDHLNARGAEKLGDILIAELGL